MSDVRTHRPLIAIAHPADFPFPHKSFRLFPLLGDYSTGTGSELRRPIGIAIVGGLIFNQALTLYTTPVVYLYFDRLREWWESRHRQTSIRRQTALGPD